MDSTKIDHKSFLEQIKTDKISLAVDSSEVKIFFREYQCLTHLSKGKTAKEIGRALDISHKTVENHLANIKLKTGCIVTSQLKDLFWVNFELRL